MDEVQPSLILGGVVERKKKKKEKKVEVFISSPSLHIDVLWLETRTNKLLLIIDMPKRSCCIYKLKFGNFVLVEICEVQSR